MKVLLSIHPEHAENILAGTKRFEYRKAIPRDPSVDTVVLYATQPVGKIVGEFSVSEILSGTPDSLWRKTRGASGISRRFFMDYFDGRDTAFAIGVDSPQRYATPQELVDVIETTTPPQSFRYLG